MEITIDPSVLLWGVLLGVFVLLVVILVVRQLLRHGRSSPHDREEIRKRWQRIEQLVKNSDESSFRHAIIEADSIFDLAMKLKFFAGSDFGGRLKIAQARYPRLRAVWQAHRLRNELVHESGTALRRGSTAHALGVYRQGLKELGLL